MVLKNAFIKQNYRNQVYFIKKGNGVIDFEEFSDMLDKTKSIADPEADLKEAFKVFDLDGDGIITVRTPFLNGLFSHINHSYFFNFITGKRIEIGNA